MGFSPRGMHFCATHPEIRLFYILSPRPKFSGGRLSKADTIALPWGILMTRHKPFLTIAAICLAGVAAAVMLSASANHSAAQATTESNSALVPAERLELDNYDWYARHKAILALQQQLNPQIVLIGDSITHFWGGEPKGPLVNGPKAWQQAFAGIPVLNMGFGWDRTQNVLWRLNHGEFDGLHPKFVVLNIGTNNLVGTEHARSNTPEEIAAGILAIHHAIRAKSPTSRILVMGVFPRDPEPNNAFRAPILKVNQLVGQALASEPNTTFLDIGPKFLDPDGTLPKTMMKDGTHPTDAGYAIWAQALIDAGIRN